MSPEGPWLTIVGIGEDGMDGLSRAAREALERGLGRRGPAAIAVAPGHLLRQLVDAAREHHAAPVDLGDLVGGRVEVTARERQGVDDHTLEDVSRLHEHFVDDADAAAAGLVHGGALGEGGEGDAWPEVHGLRGTRSGHARARADRVGDQIVRSRPRQASCRSRRSSGLSSSASSSEKICSTR